MQSFRFINVLRQMLLGACLCGFLFGAGIENEEKQKEQERIQAQVQGGKVAKTLLAKHCLTINIVGGTIILPRLES